MGAVRVARSRSVELVEKVLKESLVLKATDIHLRSGAKPMYRISGRLQPSEKTGVIHAKEMREFLEAILRPEQMKTYIERRSINIAYTVDEQHRFRANISFSMGEEVLVFRRIPNAIPDFDTLRLPQVVRELALKKNGLILVTGKAGSGKSTTVAAITEYINQNFTQHIVTIEDPIEYILFSTKSSITQKEVGLDVTDFASAVREVFRQDPDVIVIGEIRDRETAAIALTAAETGHLVIATLHSVDATETINRLLSLFDADMHFQVRAQLASVLRAVISQKLLTNKAGDGVVPAFEILIANERVREALNSSEKTHQIIESIESGFATYGMQSFDQSLFKLFREGHITYETAVRHATRPAFFEMSIKGVNSLDMNRWQGSADDPNMPPPPDLPEVEEESEPSLIIDYPETQVESQPIKFKKKKKRRLLF